MAFICLCPEKSLELGDDEKLHRGAKESLVHERLSSINLGGSGKHVQCLPGGGVAVAYTNAQPKVALDGSFLAVLSGSLQNYAYLVKKYLQDELHLPPTVTLEAIKERTPITEPALLCRLYAQLGTGLLSKLRGHFAFCLYDATTVRVLAARDPSGTVPLVQGQLADNTLFVTSATTHPDGAHSVTQIQPGHYKYGWRAAPRKYSNPETIVKCSAAQASDAAMMALAGIKTKIPVPVMEVPCRRTSIDLGRRQRQPVGGEEKRGRQSLDGAERARRIDKSRADEHRWWRAKVEEGIEEVHNENANPKKPRRRRSKKSKKPAIPEDAPVPAEPEKENLQGNTGEGDASLGMDPKVAEDFINQLGGAFREDSASVRMLTNLLCCSPCSLIVTDAMQDDHPIVFVNDSFESATGYTAQEAIGKNCRFLQCPPGAGRVPSLASKTIHRALEEDRSSSVRILNYKKDGSPMWNELSVVPLRNADGAVTHHVGMQTFSNAPEAASGNPDEVSSLLGNKRSGMLRSRSCNDMVGMDKVTPKLVVPSMAF